MRRMRRINLLKKAGILLLVFLVALVVWSLFTNRGHDDQFVGLSDPTLPRISFVVDGHVVNTLAGYTDEMDVTAMRDTITPVADAGALKMNLKGNGMEIENIRYEVCSLDGQKTYLQSVVKDFNGTNATLELATGLPENVQESVLKVMLETDEAQVINYYTRIERQEDLNIKPCLDFVQDFHNKAIRGDGSTLAEYLEPGEKSDNTTLQTVDIHSNLKHVQWGDLKPEIASEVEWSIKESNDAYTSLLADYQVSIKGDTKEIETYNVKEFFRVTYTPERMYLLNYNRTMNQVFNGNKKIMDEDGILLGMADPDVSYVTNKKGTVVSFVQERALWNYNKKKDNLSLVFSFANTEGRDARSRQDEHEVKIISMEEDGSTTFAVYGYMNRGPHEGKVGVNVFYFNIHENAVQEIAFIPSTKSFAIAEDELGKMVYYSQEAHLLYVLAGGVLYEINTENGRQEELAENLQEGQYTVSADGHLLAFQLNGNLNTAQTVRVMNLAKGTQYEIEAREGSAIRPLGFIKNDFICGHVKESDKGKTVAGENVIPMYELEIFDSSCKSLKKYSQPDMYISDIIVEENLVTINRVIRSGEVYTTTYKDYITSNEERKKSPVKAEAFSTKRKEKQMRLTFKDGLRDVSPHILRPKFKSVDDAITVSFDDKMKAHKYYVYGFGKLVAVYDKAAYAIQKAEQIAGVVISSEQAYIWERGNRDWACGLEIEPFQNADGQNSYEACIKYMERYHARRIDLTGCSVEQVLYIINKGMPVIAMTDTSHAVLLIGYTPSTVTFINPDDGSVNTVGHDALSELVAGSGNAFIGYCEQ